MFSRTAIVRRLLGAALVVAGVLKLVDPGDGDSTAVTAFAPTWVNASLPLVEIALGLWLLSQGWRYLSWIGATVVFAGFSVHTLRLGLAGSTSCGCLGSVEVNPWYTFAFDVVATLALLLSRPRWEGWPGQTEYKTVGLAALFLVVFLSLGTVAAVAAFGSFGAAVAHFRGEPFVVSPYPVDVGSASPGEEMVADFNVTNYDEEPVQIVGGTSDCSCLVTGNLPIWIQPHETATVRVLIRAPGKPGLFRRTAILRLSTGEDLRFAVVGRVEATEPGSP